MDGLGYHNLLAPCHRPKRFHRFVGPKVWAPKPQPQEAAKGPDDLPPSKAWRFGLRLTGGLAIGPVPCSRELGQLHRGHLRLCRSGTKNNDFYRYQGKWWGGAFSVGWLVGWLVGWSKERAES